MGASSIIILAIVTPAVVALGALAVLFLVVRMLVSPATEVKPRKKLFIRRPSAPEVTPELSHAIDEKTPLAGPNGVTHEDKTVEEGTMDLQDVPKEEAMAALDKLTGRDKLFEAVEQYEKGE